MLQIRFDFAVKSYQHLICAVLRDVLGAGAQVGPPAARRWDPLPEAITLRYVQEICQVQAPSCMC